MSHSIYKLLKASTLISIIGIAPMALANETERYSGLWNCRIFAEGFNDSGIRLFSVKEQTAILAFKDGKLSYHKEGSTSFARFGGGGGFTSDHNDEGKGSWEIKDSENGAKLSFSLIDKKGKTSTQSVNLINESLATYSYSLPRSKSDTTCTRQRDIRNSDK